MSLVERRLYRGVDPARSQAALTTSGEACCRAETVSSSSCPDHLGKLGQGELVVDSVSIENALQKDH